MEELILRSLAIPKESEAMFNTEKFEILRNLIVNRKTSKVLAPTEAPLEQSMAELEAGDALLQDCIDAAGWAPFHYARNVDGIPEPWRFHVLNNSVCRNLANELPILVQLKPNAKITQLLNGCSAAIVVTWLPQENKKDSGIDTNKVARINEEHLAASSSAVQNLLLLCESLDWLNYWSSGGIVDELKVRETLGISSIEKLMAVVFVQYSKVSASQAEIISGKHRSARTDKSKWSRQIEKLPDR